MDGRTTHGPSSDMSMIGWRNHLIARTNFFPVELSELSEVSFQASMNVTLGVPRIKEMSGSLQQDSAVPHWNHGPI